MMWMATVYEVIAFVVDEYFAKMEKQEWPGNSREQKLVADTLKAESRKGTHDDILAGCVGITFAEKKSRKPAFTPPVARKDNRVQGLTTMWNDLVRFVTALELVQFALTGEKNKVRFVSWRCVK